MCKQIRRKHGGLLKFCVRSILQGFLLICSCRFYVSFCSKQKLNNADDRGAKDAQKISTHKIFWLARNLPRIQLKKILKVL